MKGINSWPSLKMLRQRVLEEQLSLIQAQQASSEKLTQQLPENFEETGDYFLLVIPTVYPKVSFYGFLNVLT